MKLVQNGHVEGNLQIMKLVQNEQLKEIYKILNLCKMHN